MKSSVTAVIQTASINTGISQGDDDLRSSRFFDAANHPEIRFSCSRVVKQGDHVLVFGTLENYEFLEVRHRLRPEYAGREDISDLRRRGLDVVETYRHPLLFYTGDTDRGILENNAELFRAEVLMIECSFIADGDQERAARYRHIHFDDIVAFADRFENRMIVLTHFSRRYSRGFIHDQIGLRCPEVLRERLRLALPQPLQTL